MYEKVIELSPNNSLGYNNLGNMYFNYRELQKAEDNLKMALSIESKLSTYNLLAHVAELRSQYNKALEYRLKTVELGPDFGALWLNLGHAYAMTGDSLNARKSWLRVISVEWDNVAKKSNERGAIYLTAVAYASLGEEELARECIALYKAIVSYERE